MGNYDPYIRNSIDRQNEVLETQNTLLSSLVAELRIANDLKALEMGRDENTAMIAMVANIVEAGRKSEDE